jgi:hypothetical protein
VFSGFDTSWGRGRNYKHLPCALVGIASKRLDPSIHPARRQTRIISDSPNLWPPFPSTLLFRCCCFADSSLISGGRSEGRCRDTGGLPSLEERKHSMESRAGVVASAGPRRRPSCQRYPCRGRPCSVLGIPAVDRYRPRLCGSR